MFIDVTRYGGLRVLRVAITAIAYIDAVESGSALHLIGGETLRVNEDPAEVESRCCGGMDPDLEAAGLISSEDAASRGVERAIGGNKRKGGR